MSRQPNRLRLLAAEAENGWIANRKPDVALVPALLANPMKRLLAAPTTNERFDEFVDHPAASIEAMSARPVVRCQTRGSDNVIIARAAAVPVLSATGARRNGDPPPNRAVRIDSGPAYFFVNLWIAPHDA